MKDAQKRYLECLTAVYNDCQSKGQISGLGTYTKIYGISANAGTFMVRAGIVKKHGTNPKTCVYTWALRKPDAAMVLELLNTMNSYTNGLNQTKSLPVTKTYKVTLDDALEAFSMLPTSIPKETRKKLAKDLASWKNS